MKAIIPGAVLATSLLCAVPAMGLAATLSVPSGTYPDIATAVAAASTSDTIEVAAGSYSESSNLTIDDAGVTVRGVGGVVTITAPSAADNVFNILASGVTLEGLTIQRPAADTDWRRTVEVGGGDVTLTNCVIEGGANGVGVILFNGTSLTATGTTFRNLNAAASWAAAVFMEGSLGGFSNVTIDGCVFESTCNGWIKAFDGNPPKIGNLSVTNTEFQAATNPQALRFGGNTTYNTSDTLLFQDCEFTGTSLEAVEFHYTGTGGPESLTFDRCTFNAYNSNRRYMYMDLPTEINFTNCAWLGGQHETLIRFWGGPADVNFTHCTMVTDGVTNATSASGTDQSTFIDGWDGGGRTFTLRNCVLYSPATFTEALVGDSGSGANRTYDIDFTIIDHGAGTSAGPVTINAGGSFNDTASMQFANAATDDFELLETSPGFDQGTDMGVTTDLLGRPRPSGAAPDMGAYETQVVSGVHDWFVVE